MAGTNKLTKDHLATIGLTEWGTSASSSKTVKAASPKAAKASSPKAAKAPAAKPEAVVPVQVPDELTAAELARLSKAERGAYHQARRAAGQTQAPAAKQEVTKAERRAQQDAQRKVKDDKKDSAKEDEEILEEMKLAGLSEAQARVMLSEMGKKEEDEDESEEEEDEDLLGSVRRWMTDQGKEATTGDSLRDFNMKVRFQGHVDSTPPDHLKCILELIVGDAFKGGDLAACKPQPSIMAKKTSTYVKQWATLIDGLYNKVGDVLAAADIIACTIHTHVDRAGAEAPLAVRECAVVGFLMTMRDELENMEDEELLPACRHLGAGGRVMEKFIEFLEEEIGGSDDESED